MKTAISFYQSGPYLLRNKKLSGTKCGFYSLYKVKCCEIIKFRLETSPPQSKVKLYIRIKQAGWIPRCNYHCFTDLCLPGDPLSAPLNRKVVEIKLQGNSGEFQFELAFHKPFYCLCNSYVEFYFARSTGFVHRMHAVFEIQD